MKKIPTLKDWHIVDLTHRLVTGKVNNHNYFYNESTIYTKEILYIFKDILVTVDEIYYLKDMDKVWENSPDVKRLLEYK